MAGGQLLQDPIDDLIRSHTAILDDFGVEQDTKFVSEKLDMIINLRHERRRETLITANTLEILDRALDRCKDGRVVMLKGKSWRGQSIAGNKEKY